MATFFDPIPQQNEFGRQPVGDRQIEDLTRPWAHDHEVNVGRVTFPRTDFDSHEAKLTALLLMKLGSGELPWPPAPI